VSQEVTGETLEAWEMDLRQGIGLEGGDKGRHFQGICEGTPSYGCIVQSSKYK
jgi:hypothetical protein